MGSKMIMVGGLCVPLEDTPFGPRPIGDDSDSGLDWLQWVVNAALYGDLPGLTDAVEHGKACDDGTVFARPAVDDDDIISARKAWHNRTGGELGDDVYVLSVL